MPFSNVTAFMKCSYICEILKEGSRNRCSLTCASVWATR